MMSSHLYQCWCIVNWKQNTTAFFQEDPFENHDDVIKWKHFPRHWPFVRGIHRSPVNSPHKGQWRGALIFTMICVWINGCVNNREAGDLRRYRAHYDVIVMCRQQNGDHFVASSMRECRLWWFLIAEIPIGSLCWKNTEKNPTELFSTLLCLSVRRRV